MAKHKHGSMDIQAQENTFSRFVTMTSRIVIGIIVVLILLALFNG